MYKLMNKNEYIATIVDIGDKYDSLYYLKDIKGILPIGFVDVNEWLKTRHIGSNRKQIKQLIRKYMHNSVDGIIRMTHCVSINDTYWVKPSEEVVYWEDVSPYTNKFNELLSVFAIDGGSIDDIHFPNPTPELSTDGSFPKCLINDNDKIKLIKRGSDETAIECFAEVLFSDIYARLSDSCVSYEICNYHDKTASCCGIFSDEKVGFSSYWTIFRNNSFSNIWNTYKSFGEEDLFAAMAVGDILCLNFDRHANNHGLLVDNEKQTIIRMAPIFDENLAGVPYLEKEQFPEIIKYADSFDVGYYEKELEKAKDVMTPLVRRRLNQFVDYTLPYKSFGSYDADRINLMNHVIRGHARRLLR